MQNRLAPPPPTNLTEAQAAQIATLSAACQVEIEAGVTSAALGTTNTYPLGQWDQINLADAYAAAQAAITTTAETWGPNATVPLYKVVLVSGTYYLAMVAGTTGAVAPAWPTTYQVLVTDGTVQWALAGWLISTAAGARWHSPAQVVAVWQAKLSAVATWRSKYAALVAQVNAAADIAAVQAVVW